MPGGKGVVQSGQDGLGHDYIEAGGTVAKQDESLGFLVAVLREK